jgi:hypothetical protein
MQFCELITNFFPSASASAPSASAYSYTAAGQAWPRRPAYSDANVSASVYTPVPHPVQSALNPVLSGDTTESTDQRDPSEEENMASKTKRHSPVTFSWVCRCFAPFSLGKRRCTGWFSA